MRAGLLAIVVLSLLARVSVFGEGGTVGAWASVILFWMSLAGYLVVSFVQDIVRRDPDRVAPVVRWCLVILCVAAFALGGAADESTVERVATAVFLASFIGAVVLSLREWWIHRRAAH